MEEVMNQKNNNHKKKFPDFHESDNKHTETKVFTAFDQAQTNQKHAQYEKAKDELKRQKKLQKKMKRRVILTTIIAFFLVVNIVIASVGGIVTMRMHVK